MKLSFVVPAYNEEKTIEKCLKSIFKEIDSLSFGSQVEVVVVNNASTDRTAEIVRNFPNVRLVNEPQKGISCARACGFINSTGELVANIDADNYLPSGWLKNVLYEYEQNNKIVCLSGPLNYVGLKKIDRLFVKIFYYLAYFFYFFNNLFKLGSMVQGGNYIVKREAILKMGGYDRDVKFYGEDIDLARRLVKFGDVKFTFKLPIFSSNRRILAEGIVKMGLKYAINFFWVLYLARPFSKDYVNYR